MTTIRPARPTDQAFVANSWASSLRGPKVGWGSEESALNQTIDALLDDPRTQLLIACEPTDEDRIIGWLAYARLPGARVLEFVHVRRQRRREGIATQLLGSAEMLGSGPALLCLYPTADLAYLKLRITHIEPREFLP